jgi:hypothetical protein
VWSSRLGIVKNHTNAFSNLGERSSSDVASYSAGASDGRLTTECDYIRSTATHFAERLSFCSERDYTWDTVADIEGRRDRIIRRVELLALCAIFRVPLWQLVLPPEDVGLDVMQIPLT